MHCPTYGKPTLAEAAFCHHCGARLDRAGDEAANSGTPPVPPPATPLPVGEEPAASHPAAADRLHQALTARHDPAADVEEEFWQGRFSPRAMAGRWLALALLTVVLIVVSLWVGSQGWWPGGTKWLVVVGVVALVFCYNYMVYLNRRLGVSYRLTSQRFWVQRGVLSRVTDRIDVVELEDIRCEQGFIDRITGVGNICLRCKDHNDPEILLRGIEDAPRVTALIDQVRRKEQIRRGMLIEQT